MNHPSMNHKIAALSITILIILAACNKSQPFAGPKIYKKVDMRSGVVSTYVYNTDGTVASISSNTGSDTTFQYLGDTVYEVDRANNGSIIAGYYYFKNSSGFADSVQGLFSQQNYSFTYAYNGYDIIDLAKTYLNRVVQQTYNYTTSGKNIYELNTVNNTAGTQTYNYYQFFTANSNSIGVQDQGKYFLGASPASPTEKDIFINNSLDTVYTITYRYAYDGSGRIDTLVSYKRQQGAITFTQLDSIAFSYYN
jgi:hypothetical protein